MSERRFGEGEAGMSHSLGTRYVRVHKSDGSDFVTFDFAINDPSLTVELILPRAAFFEFCDLNNVVFMTPEQGARIDEERQKWRYGSPGHRS